MSSRARAVAAAGDRKTQSTHDLAAPHLGLNQWVGGPSARRLNERLQAVVHLRQGIADFIRHSVERRQDSLRGVWLLGHMHTISGHLGAGQLLLVTGEVVAYSCAAGAFVRVATYGDHNTWAASVEAAHGF